MSSSRKPKTINPDEVDPSVYYYDEVYDEIQEDSKRSDASVSKTKHSIQGSKYIKGIQETAELRKTEKELRKFKKFARDREEAESTGKLTCEDVYITAAYKDKLKEMTDLEAEKRRRIEEEAEKCMNFMKQSKEKTHRDERVQDEHIHLSRTSQSTSKQNLRSKPETDEADFAKLSDSARKSDKPRKKLVTYDDKMAYLEKVLAKRTVGKVYEAAVQRYMERKSRK